MAQYKLADHTALQFQLKKTVKLGGEGLVLHRGDSLYKGLRNDDLLKVKTHEDAEARVLCIFPAKANTPVSWVPRWLKYPQKTVNPVCVSSWVLVFPIHNVRLRLQWARRLLIASGVYTTAAFRVLQVSCGCGKTKSLLKK